MPRKSLGRAQMRAKVADDGDEYIGDEYIGDEYIGDEYIGR